MRRYTNMEIGAAVAGLLFVIFGVYMIIHPTEMDYTPDGPSHPVRVILGPDKSVHVTKTGTRVCGGLSVVMGVGISCLALYRGRK
jgi:hypothetical protein